MPGGVGGRGIKTPFLSLLSFCFYKHYAKLTAQKNSIAPKSGRVKSKYELPLGMPEPVFSYATSWIDTRSRELNVPRMPETSWGSLTAGRAALLRQAEIGSESELC